MDRRKTDRRANGYNDLYMMDIQALLAILSRRKSLMAGLMLLIIIPGFMQVIFKPDKYKATGTVLVDNQQLNLGEFQDVLPAGKFDDATTETQARVLSSPKIIHLTLDALEEQDKPDAEKNAPKDAKAIKAEHENAARYAKLLDFIKNLDVTTQGRTRLIDVSYTSKDPLQAANIVNTHIQEYVQYQINNRKEQVELLNKWIADQVASLKEQGIVKAQAVQDFRKESGIMLGKDSEDLIYQQISDISAQLIPIETQKMALQAKLDAGEEKTGAISDITGSALVQNLKSQASQAEQELKALQAQYGPEHPEVLAAKKKVQQARADIGHETGNITASVRTDLEAVTKQEQLLKDRLDELNRQAGDLRSKETTLESLEAEETANKTLLDSFISRYEELKSQLALNRADIRIVSPAEVPTNPVGMNKIVLLIIVVLFAVVFSIGTALLLELLDHGIENPDDVKSVLNFKLIGLLPKVRKPLDQAGGRMRTDYTEEIKRIYLALAARKAPQSILFTATKSGEGKSTVLLSLASYLQSIHAKVVVVDADTSNPGIAAATGTDTAPGLAEIMAGMDAGKSIHRDGSGLAVIPAGNLSANPVDFLASQTFQRLMDSLKSQYDFVLVDCSPVTANTDAEVISGQVDQVVLVVEWAKTAKKKLKKTAEILRQHARDVPNAILNKRV